MKSCCWLILVLCLSGGPGLASGQENPFTFKMHRLAVGSSFLKKPMNQAQDNDDFQQWQKPWQQKRLPLDGGAFSKIADDIERLWQSLANRTAAKTWSTELKKALRSHGAFWLTFFILLGVTLLLLNRGRFHLKGVLGKIEQDRFPIRHHSVFLIQHSILRRVRHCLFLYTF